MALQSTPPLMLEGTAIFSLIIHLLTKCKVKSLNIFSSLALKGKKKKHLSPFIYYRIHMAEHSLLRLTSGDQQNETLLRKELQIFL